MEPYLTKELKEAHIRVMLHLCPNVSEERAAELVERQLKGVYSREKQFQEWKEIISGE